MCLLLEGALVVRVVVCWYLVLPFGFTDLFCCLVILLVFICCVLVALVLVVLLAGFTCLLV